MDLEATLQERGARYGPFEGHAMIAQSLKGYVQGLIGWRRLSSAQREALDMILHKIARILNGDPDHADSWHDIAGYAQLVVDLLSKEKLTWLDPSAGYPRRS